MIRGEMAPAPDSDPATTALRTAATSERLVPVAASEIAAHGLAAASARTIAAAAGVAPSAINYHFGALEHLFSSAFSHGAAQTAAWLELRSGDIAALPPTPAGAVLALEHVIVEWTSTARPLALLYQEALAAGAGAPVLAWTALWRDFWTGAAGRFGLDATAGRTMHAFFQSEALYHLSTWSPALERAALRDLCAAFGDVFLGAPAGPDSGALHLAERSAGVVPEGMLPPAAFKIAEAAAAVVEETGLSGLTHRAVAIKAGVTTGAVTHHFWTVEDLVAGAIRGQVLLTSQVDEVQPQPAPYGSGAALMDAIAAYAVKDRMWGPVLRRRQLFFAAIRRPELARSAAVIRFAHGGTVRDALDRLYGLAPSALSRYAGLLARIVAGSWIASSTEPSVRESQAAIVGDLRRRLLDRLGPG
jgi:AcrR family transcriptional regulator